MKIKNKALNILASLALLPTSITLFTSLTSCNSGEAFAEKTTIEVSKHKAVFKIFPYKNNDFKSCGCSGYDTEALSFVNYVRDRENGCYYVTMCVLKQPDGNQYSFNFNYTLDDRSQTKKSIQLFVDNKTNTSSFEEDSWDNIIKWADQGGKALLEQKYGNTFKIGAERAVVLNKLPHKVRLIGFEQDTYGNDNKKAPLTFELTNLVSNEYGTYKYNTWSDQSYNFATSTVSILTKIQGVGTEVGKLFPTYLMNGIKDTNRKSLSCSNGEWQSHNITTYQTKLFLPCLCDVFSQTGINKLSGGTYGYHLDYYIDEVSSARSASSSQYTYYKNNIGDGCPSHYSVLDKSWVLSETGPEAYWFSTPYVSNETTSSQGVNDAWLCSAYEFKIWAVQSSGGGAIAPLFCI